MGPESPWRSGSRGCLAACVGAWHAQCLTLVDMERQPYGFQSAVGGLERHAQPLDLKKSHSSPPARGRGGFRPAS